MTGLARRAFPPILLLAAAYAAAPYVAVWRLSSAIINADSASLAELIDWRSVRAALKEDVAVGLLGLGPAKSASVQLRVVDAADTLPPFGASFVAGIAGTEIDKEVTPDHLVTILRQMQPANAESRVAGTPGVRHAFFDGATRFVLEIQCPGQENGDEPLRLQLAIKDGSWKVVRAWIPQDLMDEANSRT